MKNTYIILSFTFILALASCEEYDNPIDGVEQTGLFVQFGANTPDSTSLAEGDDYTITIQAPVSFESDLVATISFEGEAVYGTDFTIESEGLISVDAQGASITVPFIPAGNNDVISDQVDVTITFLEDEVPEEVEYLTITLTGATVDGRTLAGGRGPIRKSTTVKITD